MCHTKQFPNDDAVAKAFGLLYFASAFDRQRLFSLYCRLVNEYTVGEHDLREAWQGNKLKELILSRSSQLSCPLIRKEADWLNGQTGFAANAESNLCDVFESQRHILSPEDSKLPIETLEPREKLEAYVFRCQLLNGFMPDADEDNWVYLGLCTARDSTETQDLAHLYKALIDRCRFEEFWEAMVNSSMVALFRKYNLSTAISRIQNFETLMDTLGKGHGYQSVWALKRFTKVPGLQHPICAAAVD
ncbi:hypothetical protein BJY04DRAFT_217633 [Aspergillus karnatakaensis]|uniref:uncharacterized protein n=1 Tax=Aspergillus karnatakaensis TaxID=1810916 RepID=UPI003CCD67D0